jgi:hypothetical protein
MKSGRFENLVARYYRGVGTFASRLTGDAVEAVLLTHAAFISTRRQLWSRRNEVRLVTICNGRPPRRQKLCGANMFATVSDMLRGHLAF